MNSPILIKFLLIVISIIVIYLLCVAHKFYLYTKFIDGIWAADSSFCIKSDIDDMVCHINSNDRKLILIINKENNIIENTEFEFDHDIKLSLNNFNIVHNSVEYNINLVTESTSLLDTNNVYTLVVSISNGKIVLYQNDIIYAILYKDTINSNLLE